MTNDSTAPIAENAQNVVYATSGQQYLNPPRGSQAHATPEELDEVVTSTPPSDPETVNRDAEKPAHDWEKRYKDSQRYITAQQAKIDELVEQTIELAREKAKAPKKDRPATKEEVQNWINDYPDIYRIIRTIAMEDIESQLAEKDERIAMLEAKDKETARERGRKELLKAHPDLLTIENTPEFKEWFAVQPNEVQSMMKSTDPRVVSKALSLYKSDMGITTKTKKEEALDASAAVRTNAKVEQSKEKRIWKASEIARIPDREWPKYKDEVMKARKEGRFLQDI